MNSKTLLTVTAVIFASLGVGYAAAPEAMVTLFGMTPTPDLSYMARRYAAYMLGLLVMVWMARRAPNTQARRALMMGLFVLVGLTAVVSLYGGLSGLVAPIGWVTFAGEAIVALWYAYLLFIRPEPVVG